MAPWRAGRSFSFIFATWSAAVTRPVKELKGFQKIGLKAGESREVTFTITPEDLKFYNDELKYDWEPGEFTIMIGGNSRDVFRRTLTGRNKNDGS